MTAEVTIGVNDQIILTTPNVVRAIREAEDGENSEEVVENPGVEMAPGNLALTDQFTTMLVSLLGNMIKIYRGALFTILNIIRPIPV